MLDKQAFWHYAQQTYLHQDYSNKLLFLQDNYHLNINLLLLMAWLGQQKQGINHTHLTAILQYARPWQEKIHRLRALRRQIKALNHLLYESVKSLELAGEKQMIMGLQSCCEGLNFIRSEQPCVLDNLLVYVSSVQTADSIAQIHLRLDFLSKFSLK